MTRNVDLAFILEVPNFFSSKGTKINSGGSNAAILKGQKKNEQNSQGNNHNLSMRYLLFASTKKDVISGLV